MGRLSCRPDPLEFGPGPREPGRKGVRKVVVARHREHRRAQREQEPVGLFVLVPPPAIGQIARRDDQFGAGPPDQFGQGRLDFRALTCAGVKIGDMQDVYAHGRMRL